jgi:hypothetical protein
MAGKVLGNLLYFIRGNNSDFKKTVIDTGKELQVLDKKFDTSKKVVKGTGVDIKNTMSKIGRDVKGALTEVKKVITDADKKFDASRNVIKQWGKDFKTSVDNSLKFVKQNKEAIQSVAVTSGAVLGALVLELKKATKENNAFKNSLIGLQSIARGMGADVDKVTEAAKSLAADGLMGIDKAATSLKNLLSMNYTLEESIVLIKAIKDSAAFGRQAFYTFGEAVEKTTEGIKLGNSVLSDAGGTTENLSQMIVKAGYSQQDLMKASTDAGIRVAILNGFLQDAQYKLGDAAKLSNNFSGALSRAGESVNRLHRAIGEANEGSLAKLVNWINNITTKTAEWIENNKELSGSLTMILGGTAAAILAVTTFALALGKVISALKMVKAFVLGTDLVTVFKGAAAGVWSWSVAMKAVSTSFAPFLITGAIVAGLLLIIDCFKEIQKESKLAALNIKNSSDMAELQSAKSMWESKLNALRAQKKTDMEILSLPSSSFKDYGMTQKLIEAKARNTPEALDKYRLQLLEYGTKIEAIKQQMKSISKVEGMGIDPTIPGDKDKFDLSKYLRELKKNLSDTETAAKMFGDTSKLAADKAELFKSAVIELIKHGVNPHKTSLGDLVSQYLTWSEAADNAAKAIKKIEEQEKNQKEAIQALADGYKNLWGMLGQAVPEWEEFARSLEASASADGVIAATANELRNLADEIRVIGKMQDERNKTDQKMEYQYSVGDISPQEYRDYLAEKLVRYEEYSAEWINITRQMDELDKQLNTGVDWEQLNTDINTTLHDGLVGGLMDAITQARSLQDVFSGLLKQIAEMVLKKAIIEPLVGSLFPKFHSGGMIYAHTGMLVPGLKSDEVPIIAQSGERVLSRGQNKAYEQMLKNGMNTTVNMINQTSQPATATAGNVSYDGEKFVLDVILKDYNSNGPTRQLFGGRR